MKVDLTNCDREPIHIIGRIQSFGFLLCMTPEWMVSHASANLSDYCSVTAEALIGRPAIGLLTEAAVHDLRTRLQLLQTPESVERVFAIDLFGDGRLFDAVLHMSGGKVILEAEPASTGPVHHYINYVRPMTDRIKQAGSISEMCDIAARQLRALTGFDRVMVYRFAQDGSGEVIAESRGNGIDSFMGLHFPASDIPQQARRLYTRNLLRIISDIDDPTAEILPHAKDEASELDLTMSTLRAVSPIHIEYLRNMGVGASLSVSILREGELWGLFACHHYAPRILSNPVRTAAELFGELFSYQLDQAENAHSRKLRALSSELHDTMMSRLAQGGGVLANFSLFEDAIQKIVPHDGIAGWVEGEYVSRGETPSFREVTELIEFLRGRGTERIWHTDHLSAAYPPAAEFSVPVAGLLALPVSRAPRDYIILFRSEMIRSVSWAGNPEKAVVTGPNGDRLTPRKSFEEWQQVVHGRCNPWSEDELQCAEHLRVTLVEVILRLTDDAYQEREKANKRQEILIAELNHRVRNILNLVRSLISQSGKQAGNIEDYTASLGGRVNALARSHDQLTKADWTPTALRTLIAVEANHLLSGDGNRITVSGVHTIISPGALTTLSLVVHELMTNSCKYGALSVPDGRIEVTLAREADDALSIDWREQGGPPVSPPTRRGFGSTIIERSIPHDLGGDAEVIYATDGFQARFHIPATHIHRFSIEGPEAQSGSEEAAAELTPQQVPHSAMIVEDNILIALECEAMIKALGVANVHVASSVAEGLLVLDQHEIDFALVDINLGKETSAPVIRRLRETGTPFLLSTGYSGEMNDEDVFNNAPVLTKPYTSTSLNAALAALLHPASAPTVFSGN